jgi:DNA-binding transcriptional regulator YdaS (Cro superfamily)
MKPEPTILEKAIYWAGGVRALAAKIHYGEEPLHPQTVRNWMKAGRVPARAAKMIEKVSEGKFSAEQFMAFKKPRVKRARKLAGEGDGAAA